MQNSKNYNVPSNKKLSDGKGFLKKKNYKNLVFYKKSVCLYDITFYFTSLYLKKNDRTVDQMVQAARSGKQNIIEGTEAAMTSSETELKLINVARASLGELLADYEDYLRVRHLEKWEQGHPRFDLLVNFCYSHNAPAEYAALLPRLNDEEICNLALTHIHQTDSAMGKYLHRLEEDFIRNGGLRETMARIRQEVRDSFRKK